MMMMVMMAMMMMMMVILPQAVHLQHQEDADDDKPHQDICALWGVRRVYREVGLA